MSRTALAVLHNEEDAADAIGGHGAHRFTKLCTLREPKYFKTWLTRVLLCNCYSILRLRRGLAPLEELPEDRGELRPGPGPGRGRDFGVPGGERQAGAHLYYLDDLPVKEIARMLGVKENTVKTRLLRGRERFKKVVLPEGGRSL